MTPTLPLRLYHSDRFKRWLNSKTSDDVDILKNHLLSGSFRTYETKWIGHFLLRWDLRLMYA